MLHRFAMPGVLAVVDPRQPIAAAARLLARMATRLRASDRLRVEIDPAPDPPAVLGRVDLGLLDPAPAPAVSPDGACRLVLAGEIRGVTGGAAGALAAYLRDGEGVLRGRSGSFVLALWDGRAGRLLVATDRFGLRNAYYCADGDRFLLAPQVGALLADSRLSPRLDPQAAAEFLTFQCVLGERTLLEGVRLVPPASLLVFEPGRGVRIEEGWRPCYRPRPGTVASHGAALAEAIRSAATRQACAGAWRVGLPLSGGLDSRTLLAALPRNGAPVRTITYGHPDSDDVRLAAVLAGLARSVHHRIPLAPGYLAAEAEGMVARTDGMHSCLNGHARLLAGAGEVCDLLLLGNGGDCLLDALVAADAPGDEAGLAAMVAAKIAIGLPAHLSEDVVHPAAPLAGVAERALAAVRAGLAAAPGDRPADRVDAFNVTDRHRRWVLQGVPAQATHVEVRHPYYDDEVVAAALAVPHALRVERRAHIAALCRLAPDLARVRRQGRPFGFTASSLRLGLHRGGGRVRDAIRWRANRVGLNPLLARRDRRSFSDYDDDLRHGSRALLLEVLGSERTLARGWWQPDALGALVWRHLRGQANYAAALGVVLTLEFFARAFLDRGPVDERLLEDAVPGPHPLGGIADVEPEAARGALDQVRLRVRGSVDPPDPASKEIDVLRRGGVELEALLLDPHRPAPTSLREGGIPRRRS
jgi:asparagine synthase (glutamine-hydrolysing)